MKITRIGIIGAMDVEVSALYDSMIDATETPIAGMIFRKGNIGEVPVWCRPYYQYWSCRFSE